MTSSLNVDRAIKKINRAKHKARPELITTPDYDEWTCLNLAKNLNLQPQYWALFDKLDRIDVNKTSKQEFVDKYETNFKPVVLRNVTKSWRAHTKWTISRLTKKFKNEHFKCGEDDYGYNVRLKMKYFVHYMQNNCDDSPLYIFDGSFGEHRKRKRLLKDYSLPLYFEEDLFKYVGDSRRPPYRWIVIGGPRSGTGVHIDPLGTSAWNSLLVGYKRWCLFPTKTPRELVKLGPNEGGKQRSEASQWFNIVYPRTRMPTWPSEYRPIEIIQRPGETVFVPSGWWHVVLNLTETVAVTQNFVSSTNFPIVWHKTVRSRPKLSSRWLAELQIHRPDLASLTTQIDANQPIGVMSDSSSGSSSSSSSSSSGSSCSCSSCDTSTSGSRDSGQASLNRRKIQKK